MDLKTIIFFGASGSGKGTQADLLVKYLNEKDRENEVLYIETGKLFRNLAKQEVYTSTLIADFVNNGRVLPDFFPIWAWTESLIKNFSGKEHLVFDGTSRQLHEARILDSAIRFYKRQDPIIVEIKISRESATARLLKRERHDDTAEKIKNRLDWYYDKTSQAMDFFKNSSRYVFHSINGEQDKEKVHKEIIQKLKLD